ncbi:Bax inhibitor-1/YccA family protein [Paenibacillus sp. GSMTC-2017]|uniref:Bax inhibitor-1/YccA family protein n=1 Tax=Paenibacillus sp. GSMTC-2017 TaxID=2794350 RepID=UPI0018D5AF96|nr:Bax inhibitor-1/YccA family protein [Paenibacillus sp. GSMTC-2017]MBH5319704.1 Bax inhibitor-1/YccA family protein [Paenibacillus sp. GSMTC-2017]
MFGRSGNPTLKDDTFQGSGHYSTGERMTIEGTVNKTFIMLAILLGAAVVTWSMHMKGDANTLGFMIGGAIAGIVLALIISFVPKTAPFLVPIYAACEGLFLGALSARYETKFDGITLQAALLTMCVFLALLVAYKFRLIQATRNFRLGVFAATAGIALMYLASFGLGFFGITVPFLHESNWIGIGISLVIVVVAALNLVMDFDFIEQGAEHGAPKYMEWYGAFGLMVTLVWLYIEMLRLLSKIASRD